MRFDQKLLESAVDMRIDVVGAYLLAIVIAGLAFFLRIALDSYLGSSQFATYYPAVLITALLCGTGPALLVVVLCGLASWYLLVPPAASFSVEHPMQVLALLFYFVFAPLAAVAVGNLRNAITRRQDAEARQRVLVQELEHRTRNLLGLVRAIANSTLRSSVSLDDFSMRFSSRLAALSRVQGLSRRGGDSISLRHLIEGELNGLASEKWRAVL